MNLENVPTGGESPVDMRGKEGEDSICPHELLLQMLHAGETGRVIDKMRDMCEEADECLAGIFVTDKDMAHELIRFVRVRVCQETFIDNHVKYLPEVLLDVVFADMPGERVYNGEYLAATPSVCITRLEWVEECLERCEKAGLGKCKNVRKGLAAEEQYRASLGWNKPSEF